MGNKTQIETEIGWDLDLDLYDLVASRQRQNMKPAAWGGKSSPVQLLFVLSLLSYLLVKSCD